MKVSLPVCHSSTAPPWRGFEQCIERMIVRSSTMPAICGKISLTQAPLSPCRLNAKGEPMRLPPRRGNETTLGPAKGSGFPVSRFRTGLGSNVSICEGPPNMKSMMTRLARGAKCGGRRARGFTPAAIESSANRADRAREPKPAPICRSIARRERAGRWSGFVIRRYFILHR